MGSLFILLYYICSNKIYIFLNKSIYFFTHILYNYVNVYSGAVIVNRVKARRLAFEMIFEFGFGNHSSEYILDIARSEFEEQPDDFSVNMIIECEKHLSEIDSVIETNSNEWKIKRMSMVTLAVLRLAVCEFLYAADIPVSVTINEAVELSKKYESDECASFVNGVLGAIVKTIDKK